MSNLGQGKNPKLQVSSYFHIYGYFVRLGELRVYECTAGLESPAVAINRRKATVKIQRNQPLRTLPMICSNLIKTRFPLYYILNTN